MAVALIAVGAVLVRASTVLILPRVSLADLVEREVIADQKAAQAAGGDRARTDYASNLDPLLGAIAIEKRSLLVNSRAEGPQELSNQLKVAYEGTKGKPELLEQDEKRLTDFASLYFAQERYRILVRWLLTAGGVIAISIVLFGWATNPPKPDDARVTKPLEVQVILKVPTAEREGIGLGRVCDTQELAGIAVGGTLREPEVVTHRTPNCQAARFIVTSDRGLAIPILG
jgi:hypothetical protein